MAESIKFDNTELINSTYVVRYARADSFNREIDSIPKAKDDGEIIVNTHLASKIITISGVLVGSSAADLQGKIDTLKKLLAGKEKNLDITPNGGTLRRYVATCRAVSMEERDFFHISHCPYVAEFLVSDGIGKKTSLTELYNNTLSGDYSATLSVADGSTDQKPIFNLVFTTAGGIAGVKVRNFDSPLTFDDYLIVTSAFVNIDTLEIDCENKTVKKNGVEVPYYGTFPRFVQGDNSVRINFGSLLAEDGIISGSYAERFIYDIYQRAQSFMVRHTDATYRKLQVYLTKDGTPPNALTITIEGDNNGEPDGTPIATFTCPAASVDSPVVLTAAANFTLNANTRYWIVFKTTAGDGSNQYMVREVSGNLYAKGNYATSDDSGATWTNNYSSDLAFALYFGGSQAAFSVATVINYYPRFL